MLRSIWRFDEVDGVAPSDELGAVADLMVPATFAAPTLADGVLTIKSTGVTLKRVIRHSPTEGLAAPKDATILFDGKNADAFVDGKIDPRGFLEASTKTKQAFTDFKLHLEFFLPFKPLGRGQGRANSGVYLQHRYEVQVLDSFGLKGLDNECGGIYQYFTNNTPNGSAIFLERKQHGKEEATHQNKREDDD